MSADEHEAGGSHGSWLIDRLMMVLGRYEEAREGTPAAEHTESIEWLAREARDQMSGAELARLERRAERFVHRVSGKVAAAGLTVRELGSRPPFRVAEVRGTVPQVLPIASAKREAPFADLSVAAGVGCDLWDTVCEEWIELPADIGRGRYVAAKVAGESMLPFLHSGDVVLVRLDTAVQANTIIVARVPDEGYVVKRVGGIRSDRITLTSLNPDCSPIDIPARDDLILGTVIARWCAHQPALDSRT